ncbi:hypothetical protein E6B08_28155 [Pseudomonas putida]|uniref:RING-type E3 ubiquitin transferase n=1 Tax=Pseudomonas putida TaxID=303 RepID=A0A4D6XJQ2_PSEPU|nr:DUF6543 domain-containing protein [Pseudomonas putida]QCI14990.1 hypothetical protein E6B08_28155 [Pseudomonas putida]
MTPEKTTPSSHENVATLIEGKIAPWMRQASAATHRELRAASKVPIPWFEKACQTAPLGARTLVEDYALYRTHESQVKARLNTLPTLESFAREQLSAGIKARFGLDLDVDKTYLFNTGKAVAYQQYLQGDSILRAMRAFKLATQSLLHCAMQNFEAYEAQPKGLDGANMPATVLDSDQFLGPWPLGKEVAISAHAFAALCRDLDIGGQYQRLIDKLYTANEGESADQVWATFSETERCAFLLDVDRAFLAKKIDQPLREALSGLARDGQCEYLGSTMRCAFIEAFGYRIEGALMIGLVPFVERLLSYDPLHLPFKNLLLTYLPGAPDPLTVHATGQAVQAYVREQLWAWDVPTLLTRIRASERSDFLQALLDCLNPLDWETVKMLPGHLGAEVQRARDPNAWVPLTLQAFNRPLIDELVEAKRQRLKDDAQFHAVPTASEDQKSAARRWAYFSQLAMNAINLGAFFIPGLGQLMMGLSVAQLSYELFEGLESWADGERDQAVGYLLDVIENVAFTAALGAAGSRPGTPAVERIPVETPSFIEELKTVTLPDGSTRLWKPDLLPFAHDILLPAGLEPDEFGLYYHEGKTWLALEDQIFELGSDAQKGVHYLAHPHKPSSYQPPLQHNGAGAWLHELDQPHRWTRMTLLRRAGPLSAQLDEATAQQILQVSDIHEDALRRIVTENQRLPALMEDTLIRFDLDRQIREAQPDAPPQQLHEAFANQYAQSSQLFMPGASTLQTRYPHLPPSVVEALLRDASSAERQALADGQIPLQIAHEVRDHQQQVRLARAYEGLYLDCPRNDDSDRLILHSLPHLSGWPADLTLRLELRQHWPSQLDTIGPTDAPVHRHIISTRTGYLMMPGQGTKPASMHPYLHQALFETLTLDQRQSLDIDTPRALRQRLRQAPPLPRSALRQVLGLREIRPGYRSPLRLADGRFGYPLGGMGGMGGNITRRALLAQIQQVGLDQALSRSPEQLLTALENAGLNRSNIRSRLSELLVQRDTLQSSLQDWRTRLSAMPEPPQIDADRLHDALQQHWYQMALPELNRREPVLGLHNVSLSHFPLDLPAFFRESTSHLLLQHPLLEVFPGWTQQSRHITRFLRQFPNLRSLEMYGPVQPIAFVFAIPVIAEHLPRLESLTLMDLNIGVSAPDITSLSGLQHLRYLNLAGNRLRLSSPPDFSELSLDTLILDRMGLGQWPEEGLGINALRRIGLLGMRENGLRLLPAFLLENQLDLAHHPAISLQGNDIIGEHLQRVLLNEDGRAPLFDVDVSDILNARLARYRQQRQVIHDILDNWANASGSSSSPDATMTAQRNRIGDAINTFWRHQEQGILHAPLRLEEVDLAHFPMRLPSFFEERVLSLTLSQVTGTTEQLAALLRRFANVTELNIDGQVNADSNLPTALLQRPGLLDLGLRNMGLEVDDALLAHLSGLENLRSLDLSGNRMGNVDTAPAGLQPLRRLDLNDMALTEWPSWVNQLLPLEVLDLSGNELTDLPPFVLSNLDNSFPISSIALYGNPLSNETITRARASSESQRSFTFAMDLPQDIQELHWSDEEIEQGHLHIPDPVSAEGESSAADWLHASVDENTALQSAWEELEENGQAPYLLELIGRLRETEVYKNPLLRKELCRRVRRVLAIALSNAQQCYLFNLIAEDQLTQPHPTCQDGILLLFQSIEMLIANQRILDTASDTPEGMYRELRRLFRVQALDEHAISKAAGRDEAEVRLAFRLNLNEDLALGLPPDEMSFASCADLKQPEVLAARSEIQRAERGERFLLFAVQQEGWRRYLRHQHADRFEAIEQDYQARVLALPDAFPGTPIEHLGAEYKALENDKASRENELIRELTILANPDREAL